MEAFTDPNSVPTILGVSSADGKTPVNIQVNPTSGAIVAEIA